MTIRNWFKRNLQAATEISVRDFFVGSGKIPHEWLQIRIRSLDRGTLILNMTPTEAITIQMQLKAHLEKFNL